MDHIAQFISAIAATGLNPPDKINGDGKIHRFSSNGKKTDNAGWYVFHDDDTPAGRFGCNRTGIDSTWSSREKREFSPEEREEWKRKKKERDAQREAEVNAERAEAARIASEMWNSASETIDHPYITKKGITPIGVRQLDGELLIPIKQSAKKTVGLQRIQSDGDKRFLKGTPVSGAYHVIWAAEGDVIVCEGWATGVSIHMATGLCVIIAFNAGNLEPVSVKMSKAMPGRSIIIAADDDAFTDGNPGITYANKAAQAVNGSVRVPVWHKERERGTDFNDLHVSEGLDAVRDAILIAPSPTEPSPTEPTTDSINYVSKKTPLNTARDFRVDKFARHLHYWNGEFFRWNGAHYAPMHDEAIRSALYSWLEKAYDADTMSMPIAPNARMVSEVSDALRGLSYADIQEAPSWLVPNDVHARDIISCRNGFLNVKTRKLSASDPMLFCTGSLDFDFKPNPPEPTNWNNFLNQLWPNDQQSKDTLAEIIGYLLTDDTDQQKAFMLIGPKRSGKGTILRVLQSIVGTKNTSSPTFSSIGTQFGLQPLIGKRVAIISDARLSHKTDQTAIAENLLRITGEDSLSIPRKFMDDWQGKLPTRFVVATNEIPSFSDASAALASRFIIMKFTKSFYGDEDFSLIDKLLNELPSIMHWALDGLERLRARGRFVQPASGREMVEELESSTSPISAFVEDECEVSVSASTSVSDVYERWKKWCESEGRSHPGTKQSFGKALQAFCPSVSVSRPRNDGTQIRCYEGIKLKNNGVPW